MKKKLLYLVTLFIIGLFFLFFNNSVRQIENYQKDAKSWVADELGLVLTFENTKLSWNILGPSIIFEDASLITNSNLTILSESDVSIGIKILSSIIDKKIIIKNASIDGANFSLIRDIDGDFRLLEFVSYQDTIANRDFSSLAALDIVFTNSIFIFEDYISYSDLKLVSERFQLIVDDNDIHIEAIATLPSRINSKIDISIEGEINPTEGRLERQWSIATEIRDLDLETLSEVFYENQGLPSSGVGSLSIWLDFLGGQVILGTANIDLHHPEFSSSKIYESFSFTMEWIKENNGWYLALSNFHIDSVSHVWPSDSIINIHFEENQGLGSIIDIDSQFIRFDDLEPALKLFPNSIFNEVYHLYSPSGDVSNLKIAWSESNNLSTYSFSGFFNNFSINQVNDYIGFNNFTGRVRISPNNGQIYLMSEDSKINWPYYLENEILITNASGLIIWRKTSDSYRILSDNLEINFPGVFSQSNLEITFPIIDGDPIIDLELIINNSDVRSLINNFRFSNYKNEMIDLIDKSFASLIFDNLALSYKGKANASSLFKNDNDLVVSSSFHGKLKNLFNESIRLENIQGEIEIKENVIDLVASAKFNETDLNNIVGKAILSENMLNTENLSLEVFGNPIDFSIYALKTDLGVEFNSSFIFPADLFSENIDIPFLSYIKGYPEINVSANLPITKEQQDAKNFKINITSSLENALVLFPAPFSKRYDDEAELDVDFFLGNSNRIETQGAYNDHRFSLSFWNDDDGISFRRGSVRLDGSYPLMPSENGLSVSGDLDFLKFDDWLGFYRKNRRDSRYQDLEADIDLKIEHLSFFGQELGLTSFSAKRDPENWTLSFDSEPIKGQISIYHSVQDSPFRVSANMAQIHWKIGKPNDINPNVIPNSRIQVDNFIIGDRNFGNLYTEILSIPSGINLDLLEIESNSFSIKGNGSWTRDYNQHHSNLNFNLISNDIASALNDLSFEQVIVSDSMNLEAKLSWPGKPLSIFSFHEMDGTVSLLMEEGSILDIDPGANRMVGLFSIAALPRRLALDFSDVFNKGLSFDEISGDFILDQGHAYTDNLRLIGPVADIGIIGRTGLYDRDYQQQAVITSEPGNLLPTMGFLAGPGVGTAMLIFSQVFKEPLTGIGTASYCMSGFWENPIIERLDFSESSDVEFCADLLPNGN
tara:strand:+ start:9147 stop:12647 length:3501 start_codon:yes stop_codon:yes gene_type:complete